MDVEQDVGEGPDGVGVPPHHHVGEPDVVVHRDLAAGNTRVEALFVELNIFQDLENDASGAFETP